MAAENLPSDGRAEAIRVFVADSTLMGNELLAGTLERDQHFYVVGSAEKAEDVFAGFAIPSTWSSSAPPSAAPPRTPVSPGGCWRLIPG